jgi:hypothetical protein
MTYRHLFAATALLLATQARAVSFPLEVIEYIDDTKVVAFVSQNDIDAASTWDPMQSAAPLTVNGALAAVKEALGAYDVDTDAIRLASIELKEFPHQPGHWHYLVRLRNDQGKPHPRFYVVLMSGKAIAATLEPQAYK